MKYVLARQKVVEIGECWQDHKIFMELVKRMGHSANRQLPWLREIRPDPIVELHPETAVKHDICEGDWIWIASPRGRAKFNAGISPMVVVAEHGWWYPEVSTPDRGWARKLNMHSLIRCLLDTGKTTALIFLIIIWKSG